MWEPGHWKASGLQVLDSVTTLWESYMMIEQLPPLGVGESTFTLVSGINMSLTAFLVLIRTITTVIRAVTHPVGGNAAVVPTFKLGGCTKFVCKGGKRELNVLGKLFNLS